MNSEIIIYQNPKGNLKFEVGKQRENVWLTEDYMATLFVKARDIINEYLIFAEGLLGKKWLFGFSE
ncbi:hypothetical protein [Flavobacterium aurantiibacter]|uniref:Uncharacterized protein n=1 Tax=Flavobacterium aurantiibacter TaxID=2023067 RepID=A0A256AC15_9FLAO|nr:hypothetical protein [Flavobacterium aurantiibacter]OYQ51236.1 hypothetical protein CHX27_00430 [Flavobacterium aurantiibacter]